MQLKGDNIKHMNISKQGKLGGSKYDCHSPSVRSVQSGRWLPVPKLVKWLSLFGS